MDIDNIWDCLDEVIVMVGENKLEFEWEVIEVISLDKDYCLGMFFKIDFSL